MTKHEIKIGCSHSIAIIAINRLLQKIPDKIYDLKLNNFVNFFIKTRGNEHLLRLKVIS